MTIYGPASSSFDYALVTPLVITPRDGPRVVSPPDDASQSRSENDAAQGDSDAVVRLVRESSEQIQSFVERFVAEPETGPATDGSDGRLVDVYI